MALRSWGVLGTQGQQPLSIAMQRTRPDEQRVPQISAAPALCRVCACACMLTGYHFFFLIPGKNKGSSNAFSVSTMGLCPH